jgi:hypothetical protein
VALPFISSFRKPASPITKYKLIIDPLTRGKRRRTDKVKGGASSSNLGGGKLGDGLGALGDGVLRELAGEDEADRGLDLARRDGGLLVVPGEARRLLRELLEDVVDERVHNRHGLGGDADVRVHLLEHLEDVDLVGLDALLGLLLALLVAALLGRRQPLLGLGLLLRLGGLLGLLLRGLLLGRLLLRLGRHGARIEAYGRLKETRGDWKSRSGRVVA